MKVIKVKRVKNPPSMAEEYYWEKPGMPLLVKQGEEWIICSKDGEPSHPIGKGYQVEVK
jgi:hypothetical protein